MIYYVEDEKNIRELVEYALAANGYDVTTFADGETFRHVLMSSPLL